MSFRCVLDFHHKWGRSSCCVSGDIVIIVDCVKNINSFCERWLTSYFCLLSFSLRSNFSASSPISHCHISLAFSLITKKRIKLYYDTVQKNIICCTNIGFISVLTWTSFISNTQETLLRRSALSYLSLSSFRWSTLRGFLRSDRIFFFFSLSVCFLAPFLLSVCFGYNEKTQRSQSECNDNTPTVFQSSYLIFTGQFNLQNEY